MVGNVPNFTKTDVLRCFVRLNKNISRKELSKELDLGEGTVRTILNMLKARKLLDSTKKGHFLSKKGSNEFSKISECISMPIKVLLQDVYPKFKKVALVIKNITRLNNLYKLRDLAVKNGADGAIILKFEDKLYAPESDYEQNYKNLERYFELRNNDVVVVAFSDNAKNAENGAFAIAIELCSNLKKFINDI